MMSVLLNLLKANPVIGPLVPALQAAWPLIWRLLIGVVIFGAGWHYGGQSAEQALARRETELLEAHIASIDALRAEERRMDERSNEIEEAYEIAKTDLARVRARVPTRVVRVCDEADRGGVSLSGGTAVADGRPGSGADVPRAAGRDIGPALYGLADECDELAVRLIALQNWARAMVTATPSEP